MKPEVPVNPNETSRILHSISAVSDAYTDRIYLAQPVPIIRVLRLSLLRQTGIYKYFKGI